jgi:hypothetical protein
MEERDEEQIIRYLFVKDFNARGPILISAVTIEMLMADIISIHYCLEEKRRLSLFSSVLNRFEFNVKRDIFKEMLKTWYPDIYKQYKGIFREIINIEEFRNKLAHAMSNITDDTLKNYSNESNPSIFYYKKNGEKEILELTEAKMNEEKQKSIDIIKALNVIRGIIKKSVLGENDKK